MNTANPENKFKITVLSPATKMLEQHVIMAILPGQEGEFGVLAHHSALITLLKPGVIKVYRDDKEHKTEELTIQGGIASIQNNQCEVLLSV